MRAPLADEVSGATVRCRGEVVVWLLRSVPCLLLATSVTAHLTHLARHAIGTKMFSSHGNDVVQEAHEGIRVQGSPGSAVSAGSAGSAGDGGERQLKIKIGISFSHSVSTAVATN